MSIKTVELQNVLMTPSVKPMALGNQEKIEVFSPEIKNDTIVDDNPKEFLSNGSYDLSNFSCKKRSVDGEKRDVYTDPFGNSYIETKTGLISLNKVKNGNLFHKAEYSAKSFEYKVQMGDTWFGLAQKYGVKEQELKQVSQYIRTNVDNGKYADKKSMAFPKVSSYIILPKEINIDGKTYKAE